MWDLKKKVNMNLLITQNRKRPIDIENKLMGTKGEAGGGID